MSILDNQTKIKKLDQSQMLESIKQLTGQCQQVWQEAKGVKIPADYKKVKNIVINGMGGSGLGAQIIRFLFWDKLKIPLEIINSYRVTNYLGPDSLYIISTYSGNTEEPLNTIPSALARRAKILGITQGGRLADLIQQKKIRGLVFSADHNPCGSPRLGIGYSIFGLLGLFQQCGLLNLRDKEVGQLVRSLKRVNNKFSPKMPVSQNPVKQMAIKLENKIPILVGAEFLTGNIHSFSNQLNESAKNFSTYFIIPDLNHHLMEGLANPKKYKKALKFLFIQSDLYLPKNQKRIEVTKDVVENNSVDFIEYKLQSKTKLEQSFELLLFGSYVSFYLAILHGIDPTSIPWVDYFKEQLAK